jgi:hypothetical protein
VIAGSWQLTFSFIFLRNNIHLKKTLYTLFANFLLITADCQLNYWQQQVNYTIDVALNDKEHTLNAFEKIEYTNNSPDTLKFIWFHLWPNAYKNDRTAFSDQSLENGSTKFYFSNKEERGYINKLEFKVNNQTATTEDHPNYIDVIKLLLPSPLVPGEKITITTPFHVKLPYNFSRGGHDGESYQVTQWYPKPAVYDKKGWHPIPYLDQGEFYSDFGNFDVNITLPKNYVVAATGELQNEDEKNWLLARSSFSWQPSKEKVKTKYGQTQTKTQLFPTSSSELKTVNYKQDKIHDFAWFADKRFIVNHDTCKLSSGRVIDTYTFFTPDQKEQWKNSLQYVKDALKTRSDWIGEYPYNVVSAVQGPKGFGGGMEYPTITIISPEENEKLLDFTIAHEVGHNWFYAILGTNERQYPWMDEGINTFYDNRYSKWKYGEKGEITFGSQSVSISDAEKLVFETKAAVNKDQPINTEGGKFANLNYDLIAYYKTGAWLELIEKKLGPPVFDKAIQQYYQQWQFKHPYPEDFKKVLEDVSRQNLDAEFALLDKKGVLPGREREGTEIIFPFSPKAIASYIKEPSKNAIIISPLIGANSYDKFMIGAVITNYKLPASRFQFLAAPLYSTGAKKLNGLGKLNYSFFPSKAFKKIDVFLNAAMFSMNSFEKDDGGEVTAGFQKIVPGIRFTLNQKNPRSNLDRYIQWKTFFINEDEFHVSYDSVFTPTDTIINQVVNTTTEDRTLNQLKFVIENFRVLYPYKAEFNFEQGKDFIRTAFTGKYFFNYSKQGGFDVRLFAGKFFYLGSKTLTKEFATDRYHLNMTGPNGYEDYTYSDYFIGRNKFEKLPSQQIMMRDGGFKIRTDLYADKVGKTDDWLAAVNLATTIPPGINPLSLLPVKIPLKVFLDIGTYSDAWKKDADLDRFIFESGLQVSLFANTVNIYIPIVYSSIYKDYIQSVLEKEKRFLKTISFNIDISNFNLRKINRDLDF